MKPESTPQSLRDEAAKMEQEREESFARCDTDGFLSQWGLGLSANKLRLKATILENGGRANFQGLYHGTTRVPAKLVEGQFGLVWLLRDDAAEQFGRRFIPHNYNSRVQRELGLSERTESAPATAAIVGTGRGLSGRAWVSAVRTGDRWGLDSELLPDD